MAKNLDATRTFSDEHEKSVCKAIGAKQSANSGATAFRKGDVYTDNFLVECKCCMSEKASVSIKQEWLTKNKEEAFAMRKMFSALCINFKPKGENYYVIDQKLMQYLVEHLEEDYKNL